MTMAGFALTDCLEQVRKNDSRAAQALVEHLYPLVIKIVRSHLPRRLTEEDLAQEIFLKVFSRLDQYREQDGVPFEHWISRLSVRTCLDHLRAERRRPEQHWADLPEAEREGLEYLLSNQNAEPDSTPTAAREVLHRLLQELPPADRLVITLLDLEERSLKEISQLTGWSTTLTKVRAFRARRKLRRIAANLNMESIYA
jgi:RNA polymerase sigma-70 factor, ECF subfamily